MSRAKRLPAAELPLGGGLVSLSPLPGRGGDLQGDLAALRLWGADLVVSLLEPQEFPAGFAEAIARESLAWLTLPIQDYGLPEGAAVAKALPDLLSRLRAGQRIAFHCMGGCGRSGMIVLRLMVLAGEQPVEALQRLRAHRPCAVETEAQLRWATAPPDRS